MQKALGKVDVSFRSETQKEALETIIEAERRPLVVVMPTGGGKSLLFTAPACLDSIGTTIVVVPFRTQMGARPGRSTITALGILTEQIRTVWANDPTLVASILSLDI